MSLYANGRTTGIVVDSGFNETRTFPVFEGILFPYAVEKMEIAGKVLTDFMKSLLFWKTGESFESSAEL